MVEVAYELRVNGAAELSHLSVSGSDEDSLHSLHQDVVEQGVLNARCQPVGKEDKEFSVRCDDPTATV